MTKAKASNQSAPPVMHMIFGDGTPKKAVATALVVGSILTLINHGDQVFMGELPPVWKVMLTYLTPYCVTTWGAVTGKRAQWKLDFAMRSTDRDMSRGEPS